MLAVREKDAPMTDLLLRARAKVNTRNLRNETPLMLAAWSRCEACVEMLLERGAPLDVPSGDWTPLHYAAHQGDARIVARLLLAGADSNAKSPNGTTPLMMGAMSGVPEVARALLKAGAGGHRAQAQAHRLRGADAWPRATVAGQARAGSAQACGQTLTLNRVRPATG
ncbi:MAG: ankyrin repeat domain-containing protein [Betaproteobacteria bacterium]|nr:ankyrin repeat domain-containing protein [Betaproteobacteria bacterium]